MGFKRNEKGNDLSYDGHKPAEFKTNEIGPNFNYGECQPPDFNSYRLGSMTVGLSQRNFR